MVRALGIEPRTPAWKAGVLPLNYARYTANNKPERFPIVKVDFQSSSRDTQCLTDFPVKEI